MTKNIIQNNNISNSYKDWKLGNDIVDLSLPNNQHKFLDQRFSQRVFTKCEQETIFQSFDQNRILWSIWAAKEAAFKACQKYIPELTFRHKNFSATRETLLKLKNLKTFTETLGVLIYDELTIYLKWQWHENIVHCIAILASEKFEKKDWVCISYNLKKYKLLNTNTKKLLIKKYFTEKEVASIFSDESLWSRYCAKRFFLGYNHYKSVKIIRPLLEFTEKKRFGPPRLYIGSKLLSNLEVSLSHDGNWVAAAFYGDG